MTASQPPQDPFLNGKPNHDSLQNLSFMYQANIYLNGLGILPSRAQPQSSEAGPSCVKSNKKLAGLRARKTKPGEEEEGSLSGVARRANRGYEYATQHSMLKTDPSIKRTFCSKCYTVLIPGVTSKTRLKVSKKQPHRLTTTCLHCSSTSSLLAPPHNAPSEPISSTSEPLPPSSTERPLDGPIRQARRRKLVRPVPFWQRAEHTVVPTNEMHRYAPLGGAGEKKVKKQPPKQEKGQGKGQGKEKEKRKDKVQGTGGGEQAGQPGRKQQKGKKDVDIAVDVQPVTADKQPGETPTTKAGPEPVGKVMAMNVEMDEEEMMNML